MNLIFSDIKANTFHVFNNDCEYKIDYDQFVKENRLKESTSFLEYTIFEYPFDDCEESTHQNRIMVELEKINHDNENTKEETPINLFKEDQFLGFNESLRKRDSRPESNFPFDFDFRQKKIKMDMDDRRLMPVKQKFVGLDRLTYEETSIVDNFVEDINFMIENIVDNLDKKTRTDEDLIVLLTTKELITKYFCFTEKVKFQEEHFSVIMKNKILMTCMLERLSGLLKKGNVQSNEPNTQDNGLSAIKQLADSLIDLIVNPSNFDLNSFKSKRAGKSVITVFIFMVKNFIQQARVLDAIYSENGSQNQLNGLIQEQNIRYITQTINSALNFMAFEHFRNHPLSSSRAKMMFDSISRANRQSSDLYGSQMGRGPGILNLGRNSDRERKQGSFRSLKQLDDGS